MDTAAGFGLRSLTERAEQLGGTFTAGCDEQGMVLTGRVPADDANDPTRALLAGDLVAGERVAGDTVNKGRDAT